MAARGAKLTLSGRQADVLSALAERIGGVAITADLSDRTAPERLLAEAGRVDVLVANAALPASGLLTDYTVEEIDRAIDVNLRAPIVMAKLAGEQMAGRGFGHLVFISSNAGKSTSGQMALYSATKFGLRGLAMALREDMRPRGVGVSAVYPGPVRGAGMLADTRVKIPRGITCTPEDVAAATVKAIEKNIGEIDVAPLALRMANLFSSVAPGIAAAAQRRGGGDAILAAVAERQRTKR